MSLGHVLPDRAAAGDRPSALVGLVIVRGAGAPMVERRLPRRVSVTVGRGKQHGLGLVPEWVPLGLGRLSPVSEGWLVTNVARTSMSLENDWIRTGAAFFNPYATVMLQRGQHRVSWPGLRSPVSLSVSVRSRRWEDQRIPYAVDGGADVRVDGAASSLGMPGPTMSDAVRYRLAVLFRHLLEGEPAPLHLVRHAAESLGVTEEEVDDTAHRVRRRLNVALGTDLQSLEELGDYLVRGAGPLTASDLDP
jgi:hypothetical protein